MTTARAGTSRRVIERKSLDEGIADHLRQAILNGTLKPGERLTELGLAEQWQVSQGTIRAALKTLQHEGLLDTRPRRGTFVASVTEEDVMEIYTLRDTLEAFAARLAAKRGSETGRKTLEKVLQNMRVAAADGNRKRMLDLDFQFHRTIINMSGHRRLADIYANLEAQTRMFMTMTEVLHHDLGQSVVLHQPIAEAVLSGNEDAAFALSSSHAAGDAIDLIAALFRKP